MRREDKTKKLKKTRYEKKVRVDHIKAKSRGYDERVAMVVCGYVR